jgi:hypothetical protein
MTVSYAIGLDEIRLAILSSSEILRRDGFTISAELNLRRMLEAAPSLIPPEKPDWGRFPGYDGFNSDTLLSDDDIILDTINADPSLPAGKELNSLRVQWAEIGMFLVKS